MKKLLLFLAMIAITISATPALTQAHDLIPKQILEYIDAHPNATPEDIDAFLNQNPALMQKYGQTQQKILDLIRNPQKTGFFDNALDFTKLGIEHILSGADHVLFVLAILLVFVSLRVTLKSITAFTIAHSITLILAGSSILTLSSKIVEPLIAFSILFVAFTTVFLKKTPLFASAHVKTGMIFFFGLFHGLGFAGLLQELAIPQDRFLSSLLFFNVGIEIGQLLILMLALPLIYLGRKQKWYPRLIQVVAIIISGIALFWMVERIIA